MRNTQSAPQPSENQLKMQLNIAAILAESVNLNVDAKKILQSIGNYFSWQVGELWAINKAEHLIVCVSHWFGNTKFDNIKQKNYQPKVSLEEGIPGLIYKSKSPYWVQNAKDNLLNRYSKEFIEQLGLNSCFGFPIFYKQEVLGMLIFYGANISAPSHDFLAIFSLIGKQIGTFIKRRRIEDEFVHLSQHDPLTGLANRTILKEKINMEISYALNHQTKAVLFYIDLDDFKKINDTLGHEFGDILLEEVSRRLTYAVRDADIVARLGGDEFAILLTNMKNLKDILHEAEKIQTIMRQPYSLNEKEYVVSCSIGISIYPDDSDNEEALMSHADQAMYQAKKAGKNQYKILSKPTILLQRQINLLEIDLPVALERQEFVIYYQPIISIDTNETMGREALLRWRHPSGKLLNPEHFINTLQEKNLLTGVYQWFCKEIVLENQGLEPSNIYLSVPQLSDDFLKAISDNFQPSDQTTYTLQISENLLKETKLNLIFINEIKKLGFRISIENYGAGTSSLNLLRNFRVDELKIDPSFIIGLPQDQNSSAIVAATIAMAHTLQIKTLATGVENQEELNFLKEHQCDVYQGQYFSKPLLLSKYAALMKKRSHIK